MSVTINFTSPGNPPHNISQFRIERNVRAASGSIALAGDVNNVTKVITVTFSGTPPADGALAGDQMHIDGNLYRIITNTSTTITFDTSDDLSTIAAFPAAFIVLNDLSEFEIFETVGSITPTLPFNSNFVHQFTDATGTIFDFYQVKAIDAGGTVSAEPLSEPFRPGQVVGLVIDEKRTDPKDSIKAVIGGSITFEVEVMIGGRRQDPKSNTVLAELYMPSYLSPNGKFTLMETLTMTRVGKARYRATWTVPQTIPNLSLTLRPSDEYVVSYKANFLGLVDAAPSSYLEFDSEYFTLDTLDGPVYGNYPAYATVEDLRQTFFQIDAYLPEDIEKIDVEGRNKVLQYHLSRASDKLREELNYHQVRGNSSDRREYVASRAIYTILLGARGQNGSAVAKEFLDEWREKAEKILQQLKREGVAQGIPLGRG